MYRTILIFIIFTIFTPLYAYTAEYNEAYKLYKEKKLEEAFIKFRTLAIQKQDTDASFMLAQMFDSGEGCHVDKQRALKWYKFTAQANYKKNRHVVNKDVQEAHNEIYNSLSQIDDQETQDTIYQYVHSMFNLATHKANYIIPLSARLNGDYGKVGERDTIANEVEFQISVKYDFGSNFFGFNEIYSFAYTQHSFWQYYVGDAFFRSSDYNPEMFVTLPIKTHYFKALRFSAAHMSNGLGRPSERAWNYLTLSSYFQYKTLFTELQFWYRMDDNFDYNPGLTDTMGYGHVKFMLPYKKHFMTLLLRNNFKGKGAMDTSYSYPLFSRSLFLYIHGFIGYGESMSSYAGSPEEPNTSHRDDYVQKIGVGFSLAI